MSGGVYLSVDNKDSTLTQDQWATFASRIRFNLIGFLTVSKALAPGGDGSQMVGEWFSLPTAEYQSAVWAFTLPDAHDQGRLTDFQRTVATIADRVNRQVTWGYVPNFAFLLPKAAEDA